LPAGCGLKQGGICTGARSRQIDGDPRTIRSFVDLAPLPRRHRLRVRPQARLFSARILLQAVEGSPYDVAIKDPGHSCAHLLRRGIGAVACNVSQCAAEAIDTNSPNLRALLKAQPGKMFAATPAKWLATFRRVYLGQPQLHGRWAVIGVAPRGHAIAVADPDDAEERYCCCGHLLAQITVYSYSIRRKARGIPPQGRRTVQFEMIRARQLGKLMPRWQLGSLPRLRGALLVSEQHNEQLNRTTRQARFIVSGTGPNRPEPVLLDAALVWVSHDTWVISGIEPVASDSGDERAYAQTWLLTPLDRVERR
jgi:hypothetical protein